MPPMPAKSPTVLKYRGCTFFCLGRRLALGASATDRASCAMVDGCLVDRLLATRRTFHNPLMLRHLGRLGRRPAPSEPRQLVDTKDIVGLFTVKMA